MPASLLFIPSPGPEDDVPSQVNNWIPAHVTNDILTCKSSLKAKSGDLTLENARLESDHELMILLLDKVIPESGTYCIKVADEEEVHFYRVEAAATASRIVRAAPYSSTILILERQFNDVRGACFNIFDWNRDLDSDTDDLKLAFCCCLQISSIGTSNLEPTRPLSPVYTAQGLPDDISISIEYGMY